MISTGTHRMGMGLSWLQFPHGQLKAKQDLYKIIESQVNTESAKKHGAVMYFLFFLFCYFYSI